MDKPDALCRSDVVNIDWMAIEYIESHDGLLASTSLLTTHLPPPAIIFRRPPNSMLILTSNTSKPTLTPLQKLQPPVS